MEVPQLSDLDDLPVEVVDSEQARVISVTSRSNDGSVVTLTWDEVASSIHLRWTEADRERLVLEREMISKVSVRDNHGQTEFWIWSSASDLGGQLVVRVSDQVSISDSLLRK